MLPTSPSDISNRDFTFMLKIKPGTLIRCIKMDRDEYLSIDLIYTCLEAKNNLIRVITVNSEELWFPTDYFQDIFGAQGD